MSQPSTTIETDSLLPSRLVWVLLAALWVVATPLFICSPVTSDTSLFDVQAMTVMKGGVLYRDMLEPNLPGIVWVHLTIRSVVGFSSEAIRIVDLLIFGATLLVLCSVISVVRGTQATRPRPILFVLLCSLFYLTRNEWCHCQRDIWMMLPVCCAVLMRLRRTVAGGFPAVAEGFVWAIAFWIKPHIAIPALATLAVASVRFDGWKNRLKDFSLVIVGGIIAAVPGIAWLIATGAWDHFWEMMLNWNPEYLATGKTRRTWERLDLMFQRFYPWLFVHLIALPVSLRQLYRLYAGDRSREDIGQAALCACYLAWLLQTFLVQHAMDYIHVPEVILAIAVLSSYRWQLPVPIRRFGVAALLVLGTAAMPQLQQGRLSLWAKCLTDGSTPEIRDVLAHGNFPVWTDLDRVKAFLAKQNVADAEVTCLNVHSIHIHRELDVLPASRYWNVTSSLTMYPSRYDQIMTSVNDSQHRFVVVEESETAHRGQILPRTFPRQYPVVFQQGTYKVYAVQPPAKIAAQRFVQG